MERMEEMSDILPPSPVADVQEQHVFGERKSLKEVQSMGNGHLFNLKESKAEAVQSPEQKKANFEKQQSEVIPSSPNEIIETKDNKRKTLAAMSVVRNSVQQT